MKTLVTFLAIISTAFSLFMLYRYFYLDYSKIPEKEIILAKIICAGGCVLLVAQSVFIWISAIKLPPK